MCWELFNFFFFKLFFKIKNIIDFLKELII